MFVSIFVMWLAVSQHSPQQDRITATENEESLKEWKNNSPYRRNTPPELKDIFQTQLAHAHSLIHMHHGPILPLLQVLLHQKILLRHLTHQILQSELT